MVDSLIWGFHPSGLIFVKSAYHLASSSASIDSPPSSNPNPFQQWWKALWTLPVPPKIKHFTWKAFNHILPCALNLFHKKILPQPSCSVCGSNMESVTHALVDCPRARNIWKLSRFKIFYHDHRRTDIHEFYLQAMQLISKHDFSLFDYNEAQQNNRVGHSVLASNQLTHYSQLFSVDDFHEDSPALFVDAALDHKHGLTGIGFIFKIGHHQIIASENRLLPGASTPIFAEVSKVNGDWQDHSTLSGLVSQIRLFFSNFSDASLKYLPRQFNTAAHSLAKDAIRLREEGHEGLF
ncbi:uncharacterized protein LOC115719982 [Cannabis sativa]|uniref:uncharacterized protein LOC115719982 n=1 Tax=Cannabis sativa TaxID=3483 RepID=UPI0029CA92B0|nr:uncharacterized protein LOC115719982 [Cannabis sativa]